MIRVGRHHVSFLALIVTVLALAGRAAKVQVGVPNTWTTVAPLPAGRRQRGFLTAHQLRTKRL